MANTKDEKDKDTDTGKDPRPDAVAPKTGDAKATAVDPTAPVRVIVEGTPVTDPQAEADAKALAEAEAQAEDPAASNDPMTRADAAGIGKISPKGRDDYVGLSPGREADPAAATGPDGLPVTTKASTFTALRDVPFHLSQLVKDPASGTYYHPPIDCLTWADCNLDGVPLIPAATPPVGRDSKKKAAAANGGSTSDDEGSLGSHHKAPSAADQDKATKDAAHDVNKDLKK